MELILIGIIVCFGAFFAGLVFYVGQLQAELAGESVPEISGPAFGHGSVHSYERSGRALELRWYYNPETASHEYMTASLSLSTALPGFELRPKLAMLQGSGFEGVFALRRRDPGADAILDDPGFRRALTAIAQRRDTWAGQVVCTVRGAPASCGLSLRKEGWVQSEGDAERLAGQIFALADAAVEAWDRPWLRISERWRLGPVRRNERGLRRLEVERDGLRVRLEEVVGARRLLTNLTVVPPGLEDLDTMRVAHREVAKKEGWGARAQPTGNPVLDMCVSVRDARNPAVQALLEDPELTAALLPVVHGRRASLDGRGVHLSTEVFDRAELEATLDEAMELARAVARRVAELEG